MHSHQVYLNLNVYYECSNKCQHKEMNLNTIVKANMPVLLGVHEMWGGGYVRLML